jgi:UDP-N-acetyl-D-glucosamine dehydrogenase
VIAAPTPLRDALPDLAYVEAASRTLSRYLRPGSTVILESTSYPGTTQEQVLAWLEEGSGLVAGTDFYLGYSPERIDPGNRSCTLATTPKIVSGIDDGSLAAVESFYRGIVDRTVAVSSPRMAELAKLIENTFRGEHRVGERAGDVRARARRGRAGGDRRRVHHAVRAHAVPSRTGGRRPPPSH